MDGIDVLLLSPMALLVLALLSLRLWFTNHQRWRIRAWADEYGYAFMESSRANHLLAFPLFPWGNWRYWRVRFEGPAGETIWGRIYFGYRWVEVPWGRIFVKWETPPKAEPAGACPPVATLADPSETGCEPVEEST